MSDQPNTSPGPNGAGPNGQSQAGGPQALPIHVLAQYVKDFSFENPNAPQSLLPGQAQPQVNIGVDISTRLAAEDIHEVVLGVHCEAKMGDNVAFLVELSYAGLFQLPGVPAEHQRAILFIEGGRLLFPFARSVIAAATRDGGYPPLLINPIDFADMYRRQLAAEQGAAGQPPAGQQPPF